MRHIVVAIETDDSGVMCGSCRHYPPFAGCWEIGGKRGPACLAAEAKLTALIEAGMVLARRNDDEYVEEWDRAVAEVRK